MQTQEALRSIEGTSRVVATQDRSLGGILAQAGKLNAKDVERVMELQQKQGLRFGEAALRLGLITQDDLEWAVAKQYDFPYLLPGNAPISNELVIAYKPFHARAEELRALRTQLLIRLSNSGAKHRMLAVVSPGRGEGRSYVTANLAVAFSQLGERTLLIDADLRRPRLHKIFDVPDRIGLSAILSGRASRSAIVPVSRFGTLSLLPAGAIPPNPQELLSGPALAMFLQEVRGDFDIVLFDTPAAKLYADAQSVTARANSVVVLARKNLTRLADTTDLIRELSDTGARIIGTVFNAF
jgi:protein-tyrosine kinase